MGGCGLRHYVTLYTRVIITTSQCSGDMAAAGFLCVLVAALLGLGGAQSNIQEQCHVYYGGLVYPEGSKRTVEHGMHWSKTQSRLL